MISALAQFRLDLATRFGALKTIVRPKPDAPLFELMRERYLHGIMDGQLTGNNQLSFKPILLVWIIRART